MYVAAGGMGHGLVTPVTAFLASCLGGALGLHCLIRSLTTPPPRRAGWLALGSAAIGTGVWVTHAVAMRNFTVTGSTVGYDPLTLCASLAVGTVMVGTGIFTMGHRALTARVLFTGGTLTGLGIASIHYLAMAGVRLSGRLEYNTLLVAASVLVAVVAATCALWAAGWGGGRLRRIGAALAMGAAGIGMHYVGMAAVRVRLDSGAVASSGDAPVRTLAVLLISPVAFLLLLLVPMLRAPGRAAAEAHMADEAGVPRLSALPAPRSAGADTAGVRSRAGQRR